MKILAIESSCDETAVAIIENGTHVLSSIVASSSEFHQKYGGILPELAARKQLEFIVPIFSQSLKNAFPEQFDNLTLQQILQKNIDAIAVTIGPGLIGSLLVGVEAAKTVAFFTKKPLIPVNHVHAHMYANFIKEINGITTEASSKILFPAVALVVSGGHTELFKLVSEREIVWLGGTIDDAAGEAFDKTARLLGFENRGGIAIEAAASQYQVLPNTYHLHLPRPLLHDDTLNFSFSGLKTAIQREWKKHTDHPEELVNMFAFEVQEAITDVLVKKTLLAAEKFEAQSILLAGGVAANQRLREKFIDKLFLRKVKNPERDTGTTSNSQFHFHAPSITLCTDNAATIGSCAFFLGNQHVWQDIQAVPNLSVETFL